MISSCCPPVLRDPKRFAAPCAPPKSLGQPLSNHEYLRRRQSINNQPLSSQAAIVQVGTGKYATIDWMMTAPAAVCCVNEVLPAVPAVHPGGTAKPEGLTVDQNKSYAGRGSLSRFDLRNRAEWNTTTRRGGLAIAADTSFQAPANGIRSQCADCTLSGTTIAPGTGCCFTLDKKRVSEA